MKRILEVGDRVRVNESYPISMGIGAYGVIVELSATLLLWPYIVVLDNGGKAFYKQSELDYAPKTNQNNELVLVIDKTTMEVLYECDNIAEALEAIPSHILDLDNNIAQKNHAALSNLAITRLYPSEFYPKNKLLVESYNVAAKPTTPELVIV